MCLHAVSQVTHTLYFGTQRQRWRSMNRGHLSALSICLDILLRAIDNHGSREAAIAGRRSTSIPLYVIRARRSTQVRGQE